MIILFLFNFRTGISQHLPTIVFILSCIVLDSVSIQAFNNPTGTSVDVRANYVSEADQLEVVATCVSGGCPVVTAPIQSGIDSPVTDLIGGETYSFVVRAAVGEQDRPDPFRPLYTFAEGNPSQWTLGKCHFGTIHYKYIFFDKNMMDKTIFNCWQTN